MISICGRAESPALCWMQSGNGYLLTLVLATSLGDGELTCSQARHTNRRRQISIPLASLSWRSRNKTMTGSPETAPRGSRIFRMLGPPVRRTGYLQNLTSGRRRADALKVNVLFWAVTEGLQMRLSANASTKVLRIIPSAPAIEIQKEPLQILERLFLSHLCSWWRRGWECSSLFGKHADGPTAWAQYGGAGLGSIHQRDLLVEAASLLQRSRTLRRRPYRRHQQP